MTRPRRGAAIGLAALCLVSGVVSPLGAQQRLFGARFSLGYEALGGDFGGFLRGDVAGEGTLFLRYRGIRLGAGAGWASYRLDGPFVNDLLNSSRAFLVVGFPFDLDSRLAVFVEGRMTWREFRTHKPHENREQTDAEMAEDRNLSGAAWGGELLGGVEVRVTTTMMAQVSGRWGMFEGSGVSLTDYGLADPRRGTIKGVDVGVLWYP